MRKYLRAIARHRMRKLGYTGFNKCRGVKSYFAKHWREYCN